MSKQAGYAPLTKITVDNPLDPLRGGPHTRIPPVAHRNCCQRYAFLWVALILLLAGAAGGGTYWYLHNKGSHSADQHPAAAQPQNGTTPANATVSVGATAPAATTSTPPVSTSRLADSHIPQPAAVQGGTMEPAKVTAHSFTHFGAAVSGAALPSNQATAPAVPDASDPGAAQQGDGHTADNSDDAAAASDVTGDPMDSTHLTQVGPAGSGDQDSSGAAGNEDQASHTLPQAGTYNDIVSMGYMQALDAHLDDSTTMDGRQSAGSTDSHLTSSVDDMPTSLDSHTTDLVPVVGSSTSHQGDDDTDINFTTLADETPTAGGSTGGDAASDETSGQGSSGPSLIGSDTSTISDTFDLSRIMAHHFEAGQLTSMPAYSYGTAGLATTAPQFEAGHLEYQPIASADEMHG